MRQNLKVMTTRSTHRGYTLIEMLVVIAISAVLLAMLLPVINNARQAARRSHCEANLRQLGIACYAYQQAFTTLPAGSINARGPVGVRPTGHNHSWIVALLPFLNEPGVANQIDATRSIYDPVQLPARQHVLPQFVCPSDPVYAISSPELGSVGLTSYAGVHHDRKALIQDDNSGLLFLNRRLSVDEIPDGAAYVLLLGEIRRHADDLGWASGTAASLRNTGDALNATPAGTPQHASARPNLDPVDNADFGMGAAGDTTLAAPRPPAPQMPDLSELVPGGFGSHHLGVTLFLYADGRAQALSNSIDQTVLRRLASREDNVAVSAAD